MRLRCAIKPCQPPLRPKKAPSCKSTSKRHRLVADRACSVIPLHPAKRYGNTATSSLPFSFLLPTFPHSPHPLPFAPHCSPRSPCSHSFASFPYLHFFPVHPLVPLLHTNSECPLTHDVNVNMDMGNYGMDISRMFKGEGKGMD